MVQDLAHALHVRPVVLYVVAFSTLLAFALVLGFILNRIFRRGAEKLGETWGGLIFSLLESLPLPLLLLAALYTSLELLALPRPIEHLGSKLILALVVIVIFYFPAKVLILFLRRMGRRRPGLQEVAEPATFIVRALFAILALVIVLENLGVSLTGVWTTLGVGSVAVALALQETLSNFFAGLCLLADRPMATGDYIKLDSGQEGYVLRIGWRSATLRTLGDNLLVIPNSTLAKAVVTNYSLPEKRMSYSLPVSVAYGTDPQRVEKTLVEIAQQAAREGVEGLLGEPAPTVRLIPGFAESSLDFSLTVQIRQFADQYPVQSELRKRILERFDREGIEMPFPTRTVQLDQPTLDAMRGVGGKPGPENS
jgi:small-conductance mechanosensitive channel